MAVVNPNMNLNNPRDRLIMAAPPKQFPANKDKPWQLDHPYGNTSFFEIPSHVTMRNTAENYVFFEWPENIDPTKYQVVIQSLDTAGPTYRSIGMLSFNRNARQSYLRMPDVYFGWHDRIGVIPSTDVRLPSFIAEIGRGSTYTIPYVTKPGRYEMRRHGAIGLGF